MAPTPTQDTIIHHIGRGMGRAGFIFSGSRSTRCTWSGPEAVVHTNTITIFKLLDGGWVTYGAGRDHYRLTDQSIQRITR